MDNKEKSANQETGGVQDKLRMMREVEERNEERIQKWSDEHEQGGGSA